MQFNLPTSKTNAFNRSASVEYIIIAVCAVVYIAVSLILREISHMINSGIVLFGTFFSLNIFSGVLAQIQVLACVYLVINTMLRGYLAAVILNLMGIGFSAYDLIIAESQSALPGIIVYIGTIIIVSIIYTYRKRLYSYFKKLSSQKEELFALYEEISVSKEKLSAQNEELKQYNRIMKEHEKQLWDMAFYDNLTGLPNHKMIIEKLNRFIRISKARGRSFSFVFIDLDNFKDINELMGHFVGDKILQTVAQRWQARINARDVFGRLSGDEFALIIRRELDQDEIITYIQNLQDALSDMVTVENRKFRITASFGIAVYPQDGDNATDLLKSSDIALRAAKNNGKNGILFFFQDMRDELLRKTKLGNALETALTDNELYVVYQPQYYCGTNRIRGFEALARWYSPELGQICPAEFIPIAEETGHITEIGKWIMRTALNRFKEIQKNHSKDFIISINISVIEIIQPSFVESIRLVLDETGFDSRYLEIEITESVFITDPEKVIGTLKKLKNMGIRIALDDFGTGYASLKYLNMLPIDTLKIDKIFFDRLNENHEDNQIVRAIISLAHSLGITVIAEGVEKAVQAEYLSRQKCDLIQGFLMSKPLEDHQLEKVIQDAD